MVLRAQFPPPIWELLGGPSHRWTAGERILELGIEIPWADGTLLTVGSPRDLWSRPLSGSSWFRWVLRGGWRWWGVPGQLVSESELRIAHFHQGVENPL